MEAVMTLDDLALPAVSAATEEEIAARDAEYTLTNEPPTKKEAAALRKIAGVPRVPVVVVSGGDAPHAIGRSGCYMNVAGIIVAHPRAYAKKGWRALKYHPATRRIEVGAAWLMAWRTGQVSGRQP